MPPADDAKLKAELQALLRDGLMAGKVPPAPSHPVRKGLIKEIMTAGKGKLTAEGLTLGRRRLAEMEPLVTTVETMHHPPLPLEVAEQAARAKGLPSYPPTDTATELIELPASRVMFISTIPTDWEGERRQETPRRADWGFWPKMDQVELWQAVLLSLDVDPRMDPDFGFKGEIILDVFEVAFASIQARNRHRLRERLDIAEASARSAKLKVLATVRRFEGTVDLADFGRWAADKDLQLPEEFPKALPRPDWSMWGQRLEATVPDATALSCDIEPRRLKGKMPELREYFRRSDIVSDYVRSGRLPVVARPAGVNPAVNFVLLTNYAKIAIGLGWPLPDEFPRPVAVAGTPPATPSVSPTTDTPVADKEGGVGVRLPHVTKTLEAVFEVMRKRWTTFDPKNPPPQKVIAEEIGILIGRPGSRDAATLATAIRPDHVKDDRRLAKGRDRKS